MNVVGQLGDPAAWLLGLALILTIFGFAPGVVVRLISRAWPKGDPRRRELVAELYAVPRWERPVWVVEQFERVLTEAIPARLRRSRAARPVFSVGAFDRVAFAPRPHGLKGNVRIQLVAGFEGAFVEGAQLIVMPAGGTQTSESVTVDRVRWFNQRLVVHFEGINDRRSAERLSRAHLWAACQGAAGGSLSNDQLVGMHVVAKGSGRVIGEVVGIDPGLHFATLAIQLNERPVRVQVPYVSSIVTEIDVEASKLTLGSGEAKRLQRRR